MNSRRSHVEPPDALPSKSVTVPLDGCVKLTISSGPLSGSLSFAITSISTAIPSRGTTSVSSPATALSIVRRSSDSNTVTIPRGFWRRLGRLRPADFKRLRSGSNQFVMSMDSVPHCAYTETET